MLYSKLHHGDAFELLRQLADNSVDLVLMVRSTSVTDDDWIAGDGMSTSGFVWTMREVGRECRRVLKSGGHLLSFIDWRMAYLLASAFESADLRQHPIVVWDKTYFGMGALFRNQHEFIVHMSNGPPAPPQRRDVGNVIPCKPVRGGDHPTEKPEDLLRTLISVLCPRNGLVVDPFMGVGSTGRAAIAEGCNFAGSELSDEFFVVAYSKLIHAGGEGYW